jgi:hypothetical protein
MPARRDTTRIQRESSTLPDMAMCQDWGDGCLLRSLAAVICICETSAAFSVSSKTSLYRHVEAFGSVYVGRACSECSWPLVGCYAVEQCRVSWS